MGKSILSMLYANVVAKKCYLISKQNWSTPFICTVLCCFMMLLIAIFENIGILNGNKNIEYRIKSGENAILTYKIEKHSLKIEPKEMLVSKKLKNLSEKNKEETLEKNMKMLMASALDQVIEDDVFMSNANDSGFTIKNDFFDF